MITRRRTLAVIAGLAGSLGAAFPALAGEAVTLYKTPGCGCCEQYADYLRENGFTVNVQPTHALVQMSVAAGVPSHLMGCHLTMIEGYAVSGHVPVAVVQRLLAERPEIKGITLPGMPLGSPGMSGEKEEPFTIHAFGDGGTTIFAVE